MKTSELTGAQLDWAVAKCLGWVPDITNDNEDYFLTKLGVFGRFPYDFNYSTNWAQGGPIIEREKIDTRFDKPNWTAWSEPAGGHFSGPTPLIAAMRAYVASKLGDEIELPKELK